MLRRCQLFFFKCMIRAAELLLPALFTVVLASPASAATSAQEALSPLRYQLEHKPSFDKIEQRTKWYLEVEIPAREKAASEIFSLYLKGKLDAEEFNTALKGLPAKQDFLNAMQSAFFTGSLDFLSHSHSFEIRKFLEFYQAKAPPGQTPLFRLSGHYSPEADESGSAKAGFHRSTGSIYANISMIHSDEWLLIFAHELLHSLDDRLWKAVAGYGQNPNVPRFAEWAQSADRFDQLSPEQRELLVQWIESGLDRGLWAEYRAWVATYAIYCAGLKENLWSRIEWLEAIGNHNECQSIPMREIYSYLDARSTDPNEKIFSLPLIQDALRSVRANYRSSNRLPEMGTLGGIFIR